MGSSIKLNGLDTLQKSLKQKTKLDRIKKIVKETGGDLKEAAYHNAEPGVVFVKGYSKANIRDSLVDTLEDGGLTAVVGTNMHYAPYVEWGTRFMEAEPFMKPAHEKVKDNFRKKLEAALK